MTALVSLTGSYTLTPGAALSITGQRPVIAQGLLTRLLQGKTADQVVPMLGQLFALCAHAQRHTARLALDAASSQEASVSSRAASEQLALQTALDHLRSISLDWAHSPVLQGLPPALNWPTTLPLSLAQGTPELAPAQVSAALGQLRHWLETQVLQQPIAPWLAEHDWPQALVVWCRAHSVYLLPARFLAACYDQASSLTAQVQPLTLLDPEPQKQSQQLRHIAQALSNQTGFAQLPTWQGQHFETGAWTRLRHHHAQPEPTSAWTRLASRWTEVLELSGAHLLPESSAPLLASGALPLGAGQALAWSEMARGLLLHWVQLDPQGRVVAYQVLAPTEWNFHPQGSLAQALRQLAPDDGASATLLAQAFDACVACQIRPTQPVELSDA